MGSVDTNRGGEPLIKARNLDKRYNRGGEEIHVLRGLSLDVKRAEFVAFMGPSGSGKTTLLNILGGLDQPSTGSVMVNGVDITTKSRKALAEWRARHVGLVFQAYNLIPVLTAAQNVELPLLLTSLDKSNRRKRVEAALRIVGLKDRMDHFPRQLSGGQEQRAAIARAIVSDPEMLLCDEPTGDLDRTAADNILELLTLLATDRGTTILMVTHDPRAADRAYRQLHLDKGVLVDAPGSATQELHA
jgi:putative ABC transport system ATP-binding protein